MIDVSVIVPVYNTEKHLKDCLDSLVNQTYNKSKYEIILVNDCSTDKSFEILVYYEKKYSNVVVYSFKKNKGVSSARNFGIEEAKGKYLMFCDSDDKYDENAIKEFIDYAKKEKADFIVADYYISKGDKKIPANSISCFSNKIISKKEVISYMTLTSCSKFIKKDLFIRNNIYYPENLKNCEELSVIPILAVHADRVVKLNTCLYYYIQRKESASNSYNVKKKYSDLSYFDDSFKKFVNSLDSSKYKDEIEFRAIEHLLYGKCLVMMKFEISKVEIFKYIDCFKKIYPNFIYNKYLANFSFPKRLYIFFLRKKMYFFLKILTCIHSVLTG